MNSNQHISTSAHQHISKLLEEAEKALKNGDLDKVLVILDDKRLNNNLNALFIKGETYYKMQRWGDALNCFLMCREEDPSNEKVMTYIDMIKNILDFRNTDLLNP
jgi:hypothetical protein